jgi:hypothetical protein
MCQCAIGLWNGPWWFAFFKRKPNAGRQLLPKAGATEERTLKAVSCTPWFGSYVSMPPANGKVCTDFPSSPSYFIGQFLGRQLQSLQTAAS